MKGSQPRSVRVGIVISGQLVEERVLDVTTPVTFGHSLRCTLSVPLDGLPREHVLFVRADGSLLLRIPPSMTGRVSHGDALVDVAPGDIPLERGVHGKLSIGDATILFQDIARPAVAPRMALPAALRQTLADRVDRRLALFVGGSLALHIGLAIYAWTDDIARPSYGTPTLATTYQQEVIDVLVPDTVTPSTEPGTATPATPTQTPRPIVQPSRITTQPARPSQPIDSQRLASILTGTDGEVGKAGMNPRQPGADLSQQIDDARDSHATIGDTTHTSRTDDSAHAIDRDTHIANTDPTLAHVDTHHDEPSGRIIPGNVKPETSTTLTAALVLGRISTVYMAGLQRCYRLGLATDSSLSGRVQISFTVDDRGKVILPDASGVSSQVDSCIGTQMQSWRFPIPKDGDGDATDASFTVSLALQPS
jgi:hypothetical protein